MSYFVERTEGRVGWKISKDTPGRMPSELSGTYTDETKAQKAIQMFQAVLEAKRLRNMPAAQRKKVLEAKEA
jgi:hypothetical protein